MCSLSSSLTGDKSGGELQNNSTRLMSMDALGEAPLPLELQLKDIPVLEIICINLHLFFFLFKNVNVPSLSCSASYPVW